MRAALAALLLTDPTLLFLDEPTNHLDLPAMEWLEDYLQDFHGALVVVSHDRVFLDRVATHVKELDRAVLSDYPMKFTRYLEEKELRREQLEAHNEQLQQKIAQLQRFVDRFGAKNTKASQAQSKRKQIARLKAEHVIIPRRAAHIHFHFPDPPHAGRTLVRLKDSSFAYPGGADVFTRANVEIDRGCDRCSATSSSRATTYSSCAACCRGASARGWRCRACCSSRPTCCCSTSRRITSIWRGRKCWRTRSTSTRARWWW